MTKLLDGFGKACPQPLVMAKKELEQGNYDIAIQVDNEMAVKNITRLAQKYSLSLSCEEIVGGWLLTFSDAPHDKGAETSTLLMEENWQVSSGSYAVFIGKDCVGAGDAELGYNLMKMAIFTLSEGDAVPTSLLFMNTGVKLLCEEGQIVECVRVLEKKGSEVLVCGTCLDFYGLKDSLKVGEVSNMYDILTRMQEATKVITL